MDSPLLYRLLLSVNCVLCPFIVVGNIMVLCAIIRYKNMRTVTNYTIANLAAADLFTAGIVQPAYAVLQYTIPHVGHHKYLCLTLIVLVVTSIVITVCSINVIALERYLSVIHPFLYETPTASLVIKSAVGVSWIVVFLLFLVVPLIGWNHWIRRSICTLQFVVPSSYSITFNVVLGVCMAIATYQYIRIALVARRHQNAIKDQAIVPEVIQGGSWKITKMLMIVLGLYYICVVPYIVLSLVKIMYTEVQPVWVDVLTKLLVTLTLVNSLLNPVIYVTHNQEFRTAFRKLIRCKR